MSGGIWGGIWASRTHSSTGEVSEVFGMSTKVTMVTKCYHVCCEGDGYYGYHVCCEGDGLSVA